MENIVFWLLHFGSFFPYTGAATPLEELKKNLDAFEVKSPAIVSIVFFGYQFTVTFAECSNIAQDKLAGLLDEKILISLDQLFLESTLTLRTLINKGPDNVVRPEISILTES